MHGVNQGQVLRHGGKPRINHWKALSPECYISQRLLSTSHSSCVSKRPNQDVCSHSHLL